MSIVTQHSSNLKHSSIMSLLKPSNPKSTFKGEKLHACIYVYVYVFMYVYVCMDVCIIQQNIYSKFLKYV